MHYLSLSSDHMRESVVSLSLSLSLVALLGARGSPFGAENSLIGSLAPGLRAGRGSCYADCAGPRPGSADQNAKLELPCLRLRSVLMT